LLGPTDLLPQVLGLVIEELIQGDKVGDYVNTKIWYRKESDLWAQLGEKIRPGEGRFL
jgi:hypothetical protein